MKTSLLLLAFISALSISAQDTLRFEWDCFTTDSSQTAAYAKLGILVESDPETNEVFYFTANDEELANCVLQEAGLCNRSSGSYGFSSYRISFTSFQDGKRTSIKTFSIISKEHKYASINHYLNILSTIENGQKQTQLFTVFPKTGDSYHLYTKNFINEDKMITQDLSLSAKGDTLEITDVEYRKDLCFTQSQTRYHELGKQIVSFVVEKGKIVELSGDPMIFVDENNDIVSKEKYIDLVNSKPYIEKKLREIYPSQGEMDDFEVAEALKFFFPVSVKFIDPKSIYKKKIRKINKYQVIMDQQVWYFEGDPEYNNINSAPYKSNQDLVIEQLKKDGTY